MHAGYSSPKGLSKSIGVPDFTSNDVFLWSCKWIQYCVIKICSSWMFTCVNVCQFTPFHANIYLIVTYRSTVPTNDHILMKAQVKIYLANVTSRMNWRLLCYKNIFFVLKKLCFVFSWKQTWPGICWCKDIN